MKAVRPIILSSILALTASSFAEELSAIQTPVVEMAKEAGVTLPPRPWHMADIWWTFENPTEHFESLSVDVTIDRDIPSEYNLYVSPVGIAKMNGMDFYGGLQTNVNGWKSKDDHSRAFPGKGAIFSRWSSDKKTKIGLDEVRMAADGVCESAGYEGEFCSVRRPFAWTKGTYTYSIVKGDSEVAGDKTLTWFHCIVTTHATSAVTWIGSLRFEGSDFTFWNKNAAFVEIYSTQQVPSSNIPKATVTFSYPRINGAAPALKKASVNYNFEGRSASPACAKARAEGSDVVVEIGSIFQRTKEESSQPLAMTVPGAAVAPAAQAASEPSATPAPAATAAQATAVTAPVGGQQ